MTKWILAGTLLLLLACTCRFACAVEGQTIPDSVMRLKYTRTEGSQEITGHGTVVAVNLEGFQPGRTLITATHTVVDKELKPYSTILIEIRNKEGFVKWISAKAVKFDAQLDICILSVEQDLPSTELGRDPRRGEKLFLIGAKRDGELSRNTGTCVERFKGVTMYGLASVSIDHGDSGGAICNKDGELAGMAIGSPARAGSSEMDKTACSYLPATMVLHAVERLSGK